MSAHKMKVLGGVIVISRFTVGLAVVLCFLSAGVRAQTDKRPNIIFILTDDQRWDAFGAAGNAIIHTPNMDRLANEGVYFKNAFATTPICAASRASLLTAMYERTHGFTFQQGDLKDQYVQEAFPNHLRNAGYYTGFFGKLGVFFDNAQSLFDEADIYDRDDRLADRRGYYYKTIGGDSVHLTTYSSHQAQNFIRNVPADQPFYLSVHFSAPHAHDPTPEQYYWDEKFDELYDGDVIPNALISEDRYFNILPKEVQKGFNRTRWAWRFDTRADYQNSMKGYYRMISQVDHEIGNIMHVLKDSGLAENTVIVFASDNGYFLGDRQLADKWLMYDTSIRIPLIVYDPRHPGKEVSSMVLNIDIPSTVLSLAGIPIPDSYQGIALDDYYISERKAMPRRAILIEHLWQKEEIPSSEGIRTDRWKYFRYRFIDAAEELYDLENDPLETRNLAADPTYKAVLDQLRQELEQQANYYTAKKFPDPTP